MPKKNHLTNVQKYVIQGMAADSKAAKEIAAETGLTVAAVEKHLAEVEVLKAAGGGKPAKVPKKVKAAPKPPTAGDLMARKTHGNSSVIVMTEASGLKSDESNSASITNPYDGKVHKIKDKPRDK